MRIYVRIRSESKIRLTMLCPHVSINVHPSLGVKEREQVFLGKMSNCVGEIMDVIEGSKELHVRLESRPDVQVPLNLSLRTLLAAEDKDQTTFLDTLNFSLIEDPTQSNERMLTVPPAPPSALHMFCSDDGLLLLFDRMVPKNCIGLYKDFFPSLRNFLSFPRFLEVLRGKLADFQASFLITLMLARREVVILKPPISKWLDTLPYDALSTLLTLLPSSTEEGQSLRRMMMDYKSIDFVLVYLDSLTQINGKKSIPNPTGTASMSSVSAKNEQEHQERQADVEEKLICVLEVLTKFMDTSPGMHDFFGGQTELLLEFLKASSMISFVLAILRNDSVLDISDHVPLYRVVLQLLCSIAGAPQLRPLLISSDGESTISNLLSNMTNAVTTYSHLLTASKATDKDSDLMKLIPDIQATAAKVEEAVKELQRSVVEADEDDAAIGIGSLSHITPVKTLEERYVEEMKKLQFAFIEMIGDGQVFKVPFHFERYAHRDWAETGQRIHSRTKRLAQESVTLSTSLPLFYGSSIFLRCDEDRLDVVKVLITGAADTPYSNGCFELDVYFPLDYPESPPKVNFETAKGKGIQLGPHIYTDGQICLTLLNTWHGSKEERWDPERSSLLPVLVAIQSVILAEDPVEGSRIGNADIRHHTLEYAILEQIRNPPSCWKEVIHRHFWMKKNEILAQCEQWDEWSHEMYSGSRALFKRTVSDLRSQLLNMSRPEGLENFGLNQEMEFKESKSSRITPSLRLNTDDETEFSVTESSGFSDSEPDEMPETEPILRNPEHEIQVVPDKTPHDLKSQEEDDFTSDSSDLPDFEPVVIPETKYRNMEMEMQRPLKWKKFTVKPPKLKTMPTSKFNTSWDFESSLQDFDKGKRKACNCNAERKTFTALPFAHSDADGKKMKKKEKVTCTLQ